MSEKFPKYYQRKSTLDYLESENVLKKLLRAFYEHLVSSRQKKCHIFEISDAAPQFSLGEELTQKTGPMLEVGGPTELGFHLVSSDTMRDLQDRYLISNRDDGLYEFVGPHDQMKKVFDVDLAVNANQLPFADAALSAIFR